MTQKTTIAPGTFCWPELATTDQRAAERFYTALFGWTFAETPMGPGQHYTIFQKNGQDVAACNPLNAEQAKMGVPPNWLSYVSTPSVDDSVAKATAAGGKLLAGPFDVMEHGRMAVLADPVGAVFALWQAKQHAGIALFGAPGSLVWTELVTPDVERSKAFYTRVFDWSAQAMPMDEFTYTVVTPKGEERGTGGIMPLLPQMGSMPAAWSPYFAVDDVDASVAKAQALGGKLCAPAMDIPNVGRFAVLADPQGAVFYVLKPLPM